MERRCTQRAFRGTKEAPRFSTPLLTLGLLQTQPLAFETATSWTLVCTAEPAGTAASRTRRSEAAELCCISKASTRTLRVPASIGSLRSVQGLQTPQHMRRHSKRSSSLSHCLLSTATPV